MSNLMDSEIGQIEDCARVTFCNIFSLVNFSRSVGPRQQEHPSHHAGTMPPGRRPATPRRQQGLAAAAAQLQSHVTFVHYSL